MRTEPHAGHASDSVPDGEQRFPIGNLLHDPRQGAPQDARPRAANA